jgi:hypothetical protein
MSGVDLVETLATAAAEAVRARRGAIEAANRGAVVDVTSYLSWKQTLRRAPG